MTAKTLMIAGTMSSVGKSLITAGLCRLFAREGVRVAPFKAQNMSNNAAVCRDGGEIGRAQYIQAMAAGMDATVDMNPILLKPEADHKSQIIVHGRPVGSRSGWDYYALRERYQHAVHESLDRLRSEFDLILIEGAGSIAELNLMHSDIVNLSVARYANAPIILVGDIDRGGIFAQLLGTHGLLEPEDRARIRGFIVNKFRGQIELFSQGEHNGVAILEARSGGVPVLGVVPYLRAHGIPDEDAAAFAPGTEKRPDLPTICVIKLPHISNFDDFEPLKEEPNLNLVFSDRVEDINRAAAIILPGTKSTVADLMFLRSQGLAGRIAACAARGTPVVGICGGFQMLGERIDDPPGVEGQPGTSVAGLGLLPVRTVFGTEKTARQGTYQVLPASGFLRELAGATLSGYEIHQGQTTGTGNLFQPLFGFKHDTALDTSLGTTYGAISADGAIFGTYLHGIFGNDAFRSAWLRSLGIVPTERPYAQRQGESFDRFADHLARHLDITRIREILSEGIP